MAIKEALQALLDSGAPIMYRDLIYGAVAEIERLEAGAHLKDALEVQKVCQEMIARMGQFLSEHQSMALKMSQLFADLQKMASNR